MIEKNIKRFPQNFLFGSAVSSYQIEEQGNDRLTDWDLYFSTHPDKKPAQLGPNWFAPGVAERDLEILASLGLNAQRLGFEWARIMPEERKINLKAIKRYREILDFIKELKMESIVTMNHFTLPYWIAEKGGWANPKIHQNFGYFTKVLLDNFGDLNYWVTINEPTRIIETGYIIGLWPPFKKNQYLAVPKIFNNIITCHDHAYDLIKKEFPATSIGMANAIMYFKPKSEKSYFDKKAAEIANQLFADEVIKKTKDTTDFIGVNFYHGLLLKFLLTNLKFKMSESIEGVVETAPLVKVIAPIGLSSDIGWPIVPDFFYDLLKRISNLTDKPIIITENGIADKEDNLRFYAILSSLLGVSFLIDQGVDIKAFLYWSSIDTEEWMVGFKQKFGLLTGEHEIRDSAKHYGKIARLKEIDILENLKYLPGQTEELMNLVNIWQKEIH